MKALIAQGGGYYGTNVRLVRDEYADQIKNLIDDVQTTEDGWTAHFPGKNVHGDTGGTSLVCVPAIRNHETQSYSFEWDTGWNAEAEKVFKALGL